MMTEPNDTKRVVIYQLLPRLFTNTNKSNIPWGSIHENGCGKLNEISDALLEDLRSLGTTHVWLTGILEHASCTDYSRHGITTDPPALVKGLAGSPYAVRDYYDIDPDLAHDVPARMQEFEALVQRCHNHHLKVIIDFVPNHVARGYHSDAKPTGAVDFGQNDDASVHFLPSNNFYYLPGENLHLPEEVWQLPSVLNAPPMQWKENPARVTGNDLFDARPGIHDWYETVKLNYGVDYKNAGQTHFEPVPDTWLQMREVLLFWAGKQVDGFRCDMAEMVPIAFWQWCIREVRTQFPEMLFLAEVYEPTLYRDFVEKAGFNFLYDKAQMYDSLRSVISGQMPARQITRVWQEQGNLSAHMLRFMENHDEQRIASAHFAGDAYRGLSAMAVCALMHTGPVMIYNGQETAEAATGSRGFSGNDGRTSIFDYCSMPSLVQWLENKTFDNEKQQWIYDFYKRLLNLSHSEVFAHGAFYDLMWNNKESDEFTGRNVYTFVRFIEQRVFLIVAGFDMEQPLRLRINFPAELFDMLGLPEEGHFQVYGRDVLWESKEFFSDGKEFVQDGLVINLSVNAVKVFELEFSGL